MTDDTLNTLRGAISDTKKFTDAVNAATEAVKRLSQATASIQMPTPGATAHMGEMPSGNRIGTGSWTSHNYDAANGNFAGGKGHVQGQLPLFGEHPEQLSLFDSKPASAVSAGTTTPPKYNESPNAGGSSGTTQAVASSPTGAADNAPNAGGGLRGKFAKMADWAGTAMQAAGAVYSLFPGADQDIERQRALYLGSRIAGGDTSHMQAMATDIRNQMGQNMLSAQDDMRFAQQTLGTMNRSLIFGNEATGGKWAGYAGQAWGMDATTFGAGYAGMQSGSTAGAMYRMGIMSTNPDGSQRDPMQIANDLYTRMNMGVLKDQDALNADMASGAIYMALNQAGLSGESRAVVEGFIRDKYAAAQKGENLTPENFDAVMDKLGISSEANVHQAEGKRAAAETALSEGTREARTKGYHQAAEVLESIDQLALKLYEKGGKAAENAMAFASMLDTVGNSRAGEAITSALDMVKSNPKLAPAVLAVLAAGGAGAAVMSGSDKTDKTTKSSTPGSTPSSAPGGVRGPSRDTRFGTGGMEGASQATSAFKGTGSTTASTSSIPTGAATMPSKIQGAASGSTNAAPGSGDVQAPGSKAGKDARAKYIWDRLIAAGMSPTGAAGVLGNLEAESGFDPKAGKGRPKGPVGIAQWLDPDRFTKMKNFLDEDKLWTIEGQMDYLLHESKTSHKSGWNSTKDAKSVEAASLAWQNEWEGAPGQHTDKRIGFSKNWYNTLAGKGKAKGSWNLGQDEVTKVHRGEMILPAEFAAAVREAMSGNGGGGGTMNVNLNVSLPNATRNEAQHLVQMVVQQMERTFKVRRVASDG